MASLRIITILIQSIPAKFGQPLLYGPPSLPRAGDGFISPTLLFLFVRDSSPDGVGFGMTARSYVNSSKATKRTFPKCQGLLHTCLVRYKIHTRIMSLFQKSMAVRPGIIRFLIQGYSPDQESSPTKLFHQQHLLSDANLFTFQTVEINTRAHLFAKIIFSVPGDFMRPGCLHTVDQCPNPLP